MVDEVGISSSLEGAQSLPVTETDAGASPEFTCRQDLLTLLRFRWAAVVHLLITRDALLRVKVRTVDRPTSHVGLTLTVIIILDEVQQPCH